MPHRRTRTQTQTIIPMRTEQLDDSAHDGDVSSHASSDEETTTTRVLPFNHSHLPDYDSDDTDSNGTMTPEPLIRPASRPRNADNSNTGARRNTNTRDSNNSRPTNTRTHTRPAPPRCQMILSAISPRNLTAFRRAYQTFQEQAQQYQRNHNESFQIDIQRWVTASVWEMVSDTLLPWDHQTNHDDPPNHRYVERYILGTEELAGNMAPCGSIVMCRCARVGWFVLVARCSRGG